MLTLRLLGTAGVHDDQRSLSGRAAQPRRLAVLALLALAPRKTLSRDKLLAYLWPESDAEQGRHLLSVAVYELRKALGEGALVTTREDVTLATDRVAVDVDAFEAALGAGEHERAVGLYAGPLLDGFHINDAAEFEHWSETQRAHLERRFAEALERVARARSAAGEHEGAVTAWRRLTEHDRYSARVVCGLMGALEDAGDRAGALQHARAHAALMREEFGAEADPEVVTLANRLMTAPREAAPRAIPTGRPAQASPPALRPRARVAVAAAAAGLGLVAAIGIWKLGALPAARAASGSITIAVLPFENLSPADSAGVFSDGVTEEIISALSRVPSLRVVSRNSSFVFRDRADARDVAERLNVGHVVQGTVRLAGDRVRVGARLIAADGFEVWSEVYDHPLDMRNVMTIQEQIAHSVVAELAERFDRSLDVEPQPGSLTHDVQAFELFVAGKRSFHRRTVPDLRRALELYEQAITRDESYALAHAGKAEVFALLGAYDYAALPPDVAFATARASAERALQLNPDLAEGHSALGSVRFNYDWDWASAEKEYRRAIQLSPGYATARHWYSLLLVARRREDEALVQIMRARELDPLSSVTSTGLARHYYFTRQLERAVGLYRETLAGDSTFVTAHLGLGLSYAAAGDWEEAVGSYRTAGRLLGGTPPLIDALLANAHGRAGRAREAVEHRDRLRAAAGRGYVPEEYLALAEIGLGDHDAAFAALGRALTNRSAAIAYLDVEPLVDPLRADPRFAALLAEAGVQNAR